MKRQSKHCIGWFLGTFLTLILLGCDTGRKWNGIEFYGVEKQEQLTEAPVEGAEAEEALSLHGEEGREMDVRVDMEFMRSDDPSKERVCRLMNGLLVELLLRQSNEMTAEEAVAQYMEDVKEEFRSDEVASVYHDHLTGRAEYGMEDIINYRLREEVFTGGAHPCTVTTILRFNALTGEFIALDNIFPLSQHARLQELLLARLMQNNNAQSLDDLRKKGILEMTDMFISNNFALREDSIEFYYNEYDIAPYAYGASTICLSYEEAQEVMGGGQTVNP